MVLLAAMGLGTEPRQLGVVKDYDSLIAAIRTRVAELNVAHSTVDAVAGLPSGYTGKLLCDPPVRGIGRIAFGPLLGSLGMKLIAVEDPEALARVRQRLEPRKQPRHQRPHRAAERPGIVRRRLAELGSKGGRAFFATRTPEQIKQHQSAAAKARWRAWRAERRRQAA